MKMLIKLVNYNTIYDQYRLKDFIKRVLNRILIMLTFVLCTYLPLKSQIIIQFQPTLNGSSIQGLSRIKIVNSKTHSIQGNLKIDVQDEEGQQVINIITPSFIVHPGINVVSPVVFKNGKITFGNSRSVPVINQTGRFPQGSFQYCFEFDAQPLKLSGSVIPYINCYNYYIQPYSPLLLIDPLNKSNICNPKPDFNWQPPFPNGSNMRYRIVIAELNPHQSPADAIANNLPVINKAELFSNQLHFPVNVAPLKRGYSYAWQVTAYINHTIVQKSEIWSFTYRCNKEKPDSVFDTYREVNTQINGNYYIANEVLKFSIRNPYKESYLKYDIIDLADQQHIIKKLPKIKITNGLNKIDLHLQNNKAFKRGHSYLMRMYNISNHKIKLRFNYFE